MRKKLKNEIGITLLALSITIILLIILAGIIIVGLFGENGLIKNAEQAKNNTEISNEKEILERATAQAISEDSRGIIKEENLQKELNKETGEGKTEVSNAKEEFEVLFTDSNRYYTIDKNGNIGEYQEVEEDSSPGDITKDKNGNELDGSEEHPYEIWCVEDLVEWSQNYLNYSNSYIKICRTLNFYSNYSYVNGRILDCNSIEELKKLLTNTSGNGFTPIEKFDGVLEGNRCEIKNIYINSKNDTIGFIRNSIGGTIKDLKISGQIIGSNNVGGILGRGSSMNINNCINNATIVGNPRDAQTNVGTGGIIGAGNAYILNSCNMGDITLGTNNSYTYVGGIIGFDSGSTIENTFNIGNLSGKCYSKGGIFGYSRNNTKTTIKNAYNLGIIDTTSRIKGEIAGGIHVYSTLELDHVYYQNENIEYIGINQGNIIGTATKLEKDYLYSQEFVDLLNSYKEDGKYPENWLYWAIRRRRIPNF